MDVKIEQDDLNQKFLTSLAPEWFMYTIVWSNRSDLDTMSLDDLYNYLRVYEPEVQKKSESNSHNMAFISSAKTSSGNREVNTASIPIASTQIKYEDINQIDKDDIEKMDIKWNIALLSMRETNSRKRLGKRFPFKDWSYMANEKVDHALVADQEDPTEFALMAKSSSDTEVFDNSLSSKACKKNTDSLNTKITELSEKLSDTKTTLYHYKLGLSQVEARLVEFKNQEIKFYKKIRGLELKVESKDNRIERLTHELEGLKKEKEGLYSTYSSVPLPAQVYSPPKKDMPWTGLPEFADDTITDYSRPSPSVEITKAFADESELWHRRLGHFNFKTMNRLVRHNLVKGLPSKCFDNDHTCVTCLKGKQHKASCKTKLVYSVTKPLHTLHMDLFGPTSDETSGILRNFITEIENLKDLKVKIIRCDNGSEFRNKEMNDFCSRKRIKREFSNARTPQQNRVAERRNRTLIEAARTMVLVNKSQNKIPYELFNGRTPAIGFLKPFWCHVMILNTLDHLGKFDAKGDEGYFIGYSMSSKVFRVFNKRTKIVEENLHVDFLENKLIEKGAGPNWLFDIDTLTNSMNYVPLVDARTSSTNFSAHLETTTSNAQDACKADAPESSENSNPTATSTNPPADQMETLTVETLIPTVSSPVLTACLDDSPQLSSDIRLISKRVTSQNDTPSLDNILTLSNRFDDILKVTTNTGDTNRVKADLSNMENNISASPTLTLRIYKDHPTSQIIGPVDTPEEPKKIFDALKEPSWVEAMQEELLQFKIQNVWSLVNYPERVRSIGTKWVLKNKKDERGIVIRNKAMLVAQGHTQKEGINYEETLFIRKHRGDFLLVQVHVDDIIFKSSNPQLCREFEALMHEKFQMSAIDVDFHLYRSMIGSLMYLNASRPDIMFAVYACARHQVTPKECHLHAVKRIFRYLKSHLKLGTIVATSTTEAKYIAAASGCGQVLWIQNQLLDYGRARIAQSSAFPTAADEPASPFRDDSQEEAFPTVSSLEAEQDRENIIKSSTLPHDSPPRVTFLAADEGSMQYQLNELTDLCTRLQRQQTEMASKITARDLEIASLKARIKMLEDKDGGVAEASGEDATIKGRSLETGEEAAVDKSTERGSNDTEELVNVLTSLDAASILTSRAVVSIPPAAEVATVSVPTGSGMVPTASPIFTTASLVTSRKGKEKMVESETPKKKKLQEHVDVQMAREMEEQLAREDQRLSEQIARDAEIAKIHAEEELQMLIDRLDRNNETIAKYLQEYEQFAADLSIGERIELINDLIEDFVTMGSKEEGEKVKRKGLRLEQETPKKIKIAEDISKEELKEMMQLVPVEEVVDPIFREQHTALDDRLKGIRMQYLPQSIWRKSDKDRAAAMIQAIDKSLKTRRIMRSLERFVGGRLYEGDFRMLQRTI
nr:hypothetical protein [Tanacetum cinerariifolium]